MAEAIIVAIIASVPSTLTFILTTVVVYHAWHVPHRIEELVEQTNGLTEKLLGETASAATARGVQQEKDRLLERGSVDANAAALLAAAQIAADKILAAAKLAKEAKEG
jgi:hypothetical protein